MFQVPKPPGAQVPDMDGSGRPSEVWAVAPKAECGLNRAMCAQCFPQVTGQSGSHTDQLSHSFWFNSKSGFP